MRKSKLQSTSALDNTGQRIQPGLIVGEPNGYVSGDILDANATVDVVKNTSISGDSWYDDGTGKLVPVKHPNYSTQPSILPQKIGDKYVYEQVFFKGGEGAGSDDNGLYMQFTAPETSKDKQLRLLNAKGYIKHNNDTTDVDDVMFTLKFVGDNTWKLYYDIPMDNDEYDDYMFIIEYCEDVVDGGDGYYYYSGGSEEMSDFQYAYNALSERMLNGPYEHGFPHSALALLSWGTGGGHIYNNEYVDVHTSIYMNPGFIPQNTALIYYIDMSASEWKSDPQRFMESTDVQLEDWHSITLFDDIILKVPFIRDHIDRCLFIIAPIDSATELPSWSVMSVFSYDYLAYRTEGVVYCGILDESNNAETDSEIEVNSDAEV